MDTRWNDIEVIISDFDGVMTDNRLMIDETGKETVYVSRADGQAIHMLKAMGIRLVIMSTEVNGVVSRRAEKLNVQCIQGITDKALCLKKYCDENEILLNTVAYIGNDINDIGAMELSGIRIVPNDAYEEVKIIADYITDTKGGYGVIREIAGMIKQSRS